MEQFTALSRLRKGENIFVRSKNTAYDVTKAAARGKEPMHHNKHKTKTGYYNHYHMYGHSNDSHAWYLS